jgi:hypothetical protein
MTKNIRKTSMRFDGMLMAFIMFFLAIIGSYGSIITFERAPVSNVSFNPEQQHFSLPVDQESLVLVIEEKDAEEENEVESHSVVCCLNISYSSKEQKVLNTQKRIFLSLPKLKRYILFQALKLDC